MKDKNTCKCKNKKVHKDMDKNGKLSFLQPTIPSQQITYYTSQQIFIQSKCIQNLLTGYELKVLNDIYC